MQPPGQPSLDSFRVLIERSWDAVVLLGPDGVARYASPAITRSLGYAPAEFVGRNVLELVHPDDLPRILGLFADLLARPGDSITSTFRYRHRDGSWLWLEGTGTNLLDDPNVGALVAVYRDIGAQREAEEARRWLAALVDSSEDAILSKTLDGTITSWNRAAERLYGYPAEEVVGRPVALLIPPERSEELQGILARLAAGERVEHYETTRRRKDGTVVPVSVTISPIRAPDGRVVGASAITRDISEQKRLEEELRRRAEALEESDRRKTAFLHMLAHELRNPLAPLLNAAHVLRLAGGDRPRADEAREMVARQVRHLARLVDDLLDVSRLDRGKIVLQRERLDLARLVRTTTNDHRATVERAGLDLHLAVPETPVWVRGDATRLAQVLGNLLDNAAKFTEPGGTVSVRLAPAGDRRWAELRVRDTGVGISPELLARLFEPFNQADQSLPRSKGGLGLGLALVKGLVELHGGSVEVHSAGTGQGAEVVVRLPLEQEPAALSRGSADSRRNGGRLRILVVEDNKDAADSLRVFLELLGHDVAVAYTGPEGVQSARLRRPDVVLCDIGLPGLDGYAVARELRQDPTTAEARLIAITGYGSDDDRRRSREAGFDLHLTKPVDPVDLQPLLGRPKRL